jgi:cytochrome c-type biogenesis protein CcmH/NrfF
MMSLVRAPGSRMMPRAVLGLAMVALLAATPALAQTVLPPEQEKIATEAMSQLKSPYTAFHTVDMCPSAGALRDSIRVAAATGMSTDQIVEDVLARHGEQLRILPKRSGAGLWAWLAPPLLLIGGAVLLAYRFRVARNEAPAPVAVSTLSDQDRTLVAAALRDWERDGQEDP